MISGCSGGGKSTLLEELARRGYDAGVLPQDAVAGRADFVLDTLGRQRPTDE